MPSNRSGVLLVPEVGRSIRRAPPAMNSFDLAGTAALGSTLAGLTGRAAS